MMGLFLFDMIIFDLLERMTKIIGMNHGLVMSSHFNDGY